VHQQVPNLLSKKCLNTHRNSARLSNILHFSLQLLSNSHLRTELTTVGQKQFHSPPPTSRKFKVILYSISVNEYNLTTTLTSQVISIATILQDAAQIKKNEKKIQIYSTCSYISALENSSLLCNYVLY
jgi:nickel-dependent lactate racemase